MQLFHDKAIKKTYFGMRVIGAQRLLDSLRNSLLESSVLLLSPPLCNLKRWPYLDLSMCVSAAAVRASD